MLILFDEDNFLIFLNAKLYISESGAEVASQKASVARVLDFSMYVVVKTNVLDSCHDQLLSILKTDTSEDQSEDTDILHCLWFHHNERVRSKYRDMCETDADNISDALTKDYMKELLNKCGLVFDESSSQLSSKLERKQCTLCNVDASITWFYEAVTWETDDDMYDNTSMGKINANNCEYRKENLENELAVLKHLE